MGKLIVLEGIDGSGKSTQLKILTQRLKQEGREFMTVSFPRYSEPSSTLVRMYLEGKMGPRPDDVNPYAASTFFTVDRFASFKTEKWGEYYTCGGLVLTDRYTTSNAVHQGAKLKEEERRGFFLWLYDFEFRLMGLPRPDHVFYMDIDFEKALGRIKNRSGVEDIHEKDENYMYLCSQCIRQAAQVYGWTRIDAGKSVSEIHEEIYGHVKGELL